MERFTFPQWANRVPILILGLLTFGAGYVAVVGVYGTSPGTINVGYSPKQPIEFSHKLHAGTLKIDCRYCHSTVDQAAHAAVPPTKTCLNCHSAANPDGTVSLSAIHVKSDKLLPLHQAQATDEGIEWIKVHDLPDFAYFNHAAHVTRGVGCVSCHGRVDRMDQVYQVEPLSMSWCLDCHRNPEPHLRRDEFITVMDYVPEPGEGAAVMAEKGIHSSTNCSTCHR
jgi:menaquinone reductase, multiheme cytochrome c subunit